jgi:phosphatidylserine decarboxylase precursor-related protein
MYTTLLYRESPVTAVILTIITVYLLYNGWYRLGCGLLLILVALMTFYRYKACTPLPLGITGYTIVSPNEGKITNIDYTDGIATVSTYMNIFNNHTQIYPVDGTVIYRYYDRTGEFKLVNDGEKSKNNEKKLHYIRTLDGRVIVVTQIAGFLPRCIASSDVVPDSVKAGQYMGIIKFGSRVDISFPVASSAGLTVAVGDKVSIGDVLYKE